MDNQGRSRGPALRRDVPRAVQGIKEQRRQAPVEQPKVHIGFRLAADVVKGVRATGPGYNARVEKVLREALANGQF